MNGMSLSPQKSFFYIGEKMPSSIVPIDRTRDYSVKPLSGLRYGNFDGEVYLPPINKGSKIGQHSLSYLNNQQIYNKVCDWYETWRPWQQCVLLCGIVNRCSIRQLDILSTSLEPVKHRDYRTAYKCHYPSTPFRKQRQSSPLSLPPLPISRGSRGLSLFGDEDTPGFSESRNKVDNSGYYQLNNPVQTLELPSPEGGMTDYTPSVTPLDPAEEAKLKRSRLELAHDYAVFTEPVKEKTLNAGTVHKFADKLSKNILDSVLKRDQYDSETEESSRSESVDPKLIYSVEKPSSQFKEAPPPQQRKKKKKSKLFKSKPATIRESSREGIVSPWKESTNITKKTKSSMSVIDVQHQNVSEAKRKEHEPTKSTSRPISTVHIVTPYNHIPQSRQSEPSRLSRRSISFVRYQMFGSMMVSTPDFFPEKETKKGPMQREVKFERSARFKRFRGVAQSLPVPLQRLYKGHKWWPNMPHDGTKFVKASKNDLLTNFKMQLQEIYKWLSQWESYEKINLMNVILKISGPDALNFLMNYIQQRLVDARDVNRLSDKLMLYIFSFLDPEEIMMAAQVCRKWRYLCATDQLWMIKCHELGISEGIENMEDIVNRANTYSMGIDWKLAYRELKELTEVVKKAKLREIAEEEAENRRHEEELRKRKRKPSISLEIDVKRGTVHEIKEEKRMRKLKREEMRAKGQEVETSDSDLSTEDLREYDDYVFQSTEDQPFIRRSKAPYQWKRIYGHETSAAFPPQIPERTRTEIEMGLEKTIKSDEMKFKMKKEETTVENLKAKLREKTPRKKSEPKEKAYDIRTELRQAIDILGKSLPSMRLEWRKPETFDDKTSIKSGSTATTMTGRYMGVVKSVRRVRKFQGHMNGVLCIQYDRKRLISAGLDRTIRIWDIRSGQSIHKFYGHKGGIRCLQFEGNTLVTGSWDTTIMVWDLKEFELTNTLSDHTGCVSCLQMNDEYIVSGSHDMTVRVWFRCTCTQFKVLRGHKGPINCVCLDDDVVISGSSDGCIRMVEILSGLCVRTFHGKQEHILSLSVQGDLILSGDIQGCVFFWNKATGDCEAAIQAHSAPINKVVYHQGRFTTASSDYTIREWDLMTMTCVRALQGHLGAVRDVKVSDDRIVSCSDDGTIRIWDFLNTKPSKTVADDVENTADNSS